MRDFLTEATDVQEQIKGQDHAILYFSQIKLLQQWRLTLALSCDARQLMNVVKQQIVPLLQHSFSLADIVYQYAHPSLDSEAEQRVWDNLAVATLIAQSTYRLPPSWLSKLDKAYASGPDFCQTMQPELPGMAKEFDQCSDEFQYQVKKYFQKLFGSEQAVLSLVFSIVPLRFHDLVHKTVAKPQIVKQITSMFYSLCGKKNLREIEWEPTLFSTWMTEMLEERAAQAEATQYTFNWIFRGCSFEKKLEKKDLTWLSESEKTIRSKNLYSMATKWKKSKPNMWMRYCTSWCIIFLTLLSYCRTETQFDHRLCQPFLKK